MILEIKSLFDHVLKNWALKSRNTKLFQAGIAEKKLNYEVCRSLYNLDNKKGKREAKE